MHAHARQQNSHEANIKINLMHKNKKNRKAKVTTKKKNNRKINEKKKPVQYVVGALVVAATIHELRVRTEHNNQKLSVFATEFYQTHLAQ